MDFDLSDDQKLLRDTARRVLEKECSSERVREHLDEPRGYPEGLWTHMAEQGWLGLVVPEEHGGIGLGLLDLAVILEELGRAVAPGPFLSTVLLGALPLLEAGTDEQRATWLPRIAQGEARGTLAWVERDGRWSADGIGLEARSDGAALVLEGEKHFVLDAHVADFLVVAARSPEVSPWSSSISRRTGSRRPCCPPSTPPAARAPCASTPSASTRARSSGPRGVRLPSSTGSSSGPGRGWRPSA